MERSVAVRYRVEIDDAKRKLKEIGEATKGVADKAKAVGPAAKQGFSDMLTWADKNSASLNTLAMGMGLVGAALTGMAALAVKRFADFDQAMSNVVATGDDARASQDRLRKAALDAGASTVFSATESANAIEELLKAGLSAEDVLGGGLTGALDLAAAGGLGVADAAEIAAVSLAQFNLKGDKTQHVADLLAAGAGKATGEVADLGAALNQAGLVANQTGLTIEETTGGLAAFAKAGLVGSDAGTSFKSMLQRLTPQSTEAKRAMDDLGISAYGSQGQFIGLAEFAGNLETAMRDLTPEQRNAAMATIFGSDAVRAASVIYENGEAGIREWIAAVDDTGFASETAATRLDNLKGDLEGLGGAWETAMINIGSSANGPLREVVQAATDAVTALSNMPDAAQGALMAIIGGGGLAVLGVAGLIKLVTGVAEARAAFKTLGISMRTASLAAGGIGAALAIGTLAFSTWAENAAKAREVTADFLTTLDAAGNRTAATVESINSALAAPEHAGKSLIDMAKEYGLAIEDLQGYALGQVDSIAQVNAAMDEYVDAHGGGVSATRSAQIHTEQLTGALDVLANGLTSAEKTALQEALANEASGTAKGENAAATEVLTAAQQAESAATEEATRALEDWLKMAADSDASFISLMGGYDSIIQKNKDVAAATAEGTKDSSDSWEDYYDGFTVSLGDYLTELESMVSAQTDWEKNMLILSGKVSQGVLDDLAKLGPDGAPLVADLVNASDEELARLETVYGQRSSEATSEFAANLQAAGPVLAQIMARHGKDASDAAAAALASGELTLQQVIDQYDLAFVVDAETGVAQRRIDTLITTNDGKRVRIYTDVIGGAAPMAGARVAVQADGGLWDGGRQKRFGNGGINALGQLVPRVPQIVAGGANILWGEPETGWEAYISGKPSERDRNLDIWAESGRRLGAETAPISARYAVGHISGVPATASYGSTASGMPQPSVTPEAIRAALAGLAFETDGDYVRFVARGEARAAIRAGGGR